MQIYHPNKRKAEVAWFSWPLENMIQFCRKLTPQLGSMETVGLLPSHRTMNKMRQASSLAPRKARISTHHHSPPLPRPLDFTPSEHPRPSLGIPNHQVAGDVPLLRSAVFQLVTCKKVCPSELGLAHEFSSLGPKKMLRKCTGSHTTPQKSIVFHFFLVALSTWWFLLSLGFPTTTRPAAVLFQLLTD